MFIWSSLDKAVAERFVQGICSLVSTQAQAEILIVNMTDGLGSAPSPAPLLSLQCLSLEAAEQPPPHQMHLSIAEIPDHEQQHK